MMLKDRFEHRHRKLRPSSHSKSNQIAVQTIPGVQHHLPTAAGVSRYVCALSVGQRDDILDQSVIIVALINIYIQN